MKYVKDQFNRYYRYKISKVISHYWENAVHFWKPSFKFRLRRSIKNCLYPHPTKLPDLYLAGESFSSHQAWIEGALETADLAVKEALEKNLKYKQYTLKTIPANCLVIDGRVLDVSKWKYSHPGSKIVIENHLQEDVSQLFHQIHNSHYSNSVLLQLQVGFI